MFLNSPFNPKIKLVRQLHQKKYRDRHDLFLIEGETLILEAMRSGLRFEMLFYTENFNHPEVLGLAETHWQVTSELMNSITTLKSPPEVIAIAPKTWPSLHPSAFPIQVISVGLQDPGNFGALLRLAEAMQVQMIWTTEHHQDAFHPKVVRGAMGSSFRIPVKPLTLTHITELQSEGWQLVASVPAGGKSLYQFPFPEKTLLLIGNEGQGLPGTWLKQAHAHLTIPIYPIVDSLNVTSSCAMILYEYVRQRNT